MPVKRKMVSKFTGLKTVVKDPRELEDGTPQDALNSITGKDGDHIELRLGTQLLGKTRATGAGKVTGLKVGLLGSKEIPFFSYGRSLKYYDSVTNDTIEVGTNLLPAAANGEDVALESYNNLAGSFIYASSPHSSIYKIPLANPGSAVDQNSLSFRGYIKAKQNRLFNWNNLVNSTGAWNKTDLNLSYVDKTLFSAYTQITKESIGTGDGNTKAFTGTLAGRTGTRTLFTVQVFSPVTALATITNITQASSAVVTAVNTFAVGDVVLFSNVVGMTEINGLVGTVTSADGTHFTVAINSTTFTGYGSAGNAGKCEIFNDNNDGTLTSTLGGTGTINYATGTISVSFNTAPIASQSLIVNYLWEDSTSQGICDFSFTSSNRTTGQGDYFAQKDGGGDFMNLYAIGDDLICLHRLKSWDLVLTADDTKATNMPYRDKVNIPYWRAGDETDDGILALFIGDKNYPKLAILSFGQYTTNIVPSILSDDIDLTGYGTDYPVVKRWGDYDILCLQNQTNGVNDPGNDVMFIRNIKSGFFDKLDFPASVLDSYQGGLIAGDPASNNVFQLFSGYDDDGQIINNYWISNIDDLGSDGTKKYTLFIIEGYISKDQTIQ